MKIFVKVEIVIEEIHIHIHEPAMQSDADSLYSVTCPDCGWSKTYTSEKVGKRGLATHRSRHCEGPASEAGKIWSMMNGAKPSKNGS